LSSAREIRPAIFPSLERLNLQDNQLTSMDLLGATFPVLQSLQLDGNQLSKVPDFIFELGSLRNLTIQKNPALNASSLNTTQFAFLAQLTTFSIEGVTPTRACPPIEVIRRLNGSFTFCIGQNDSSSSGSGGVSVADVVPVPSPTTNVANAAPTHHRSKTGLIVGIVVGAIALLLIIALLYRWCVRRRDRRRDEEPHKPTFTSVGSFIGGGGNMGIGKQHAAHSMMDDFLGDPNNGHYDAFVPLRSNASSEQSSDSYPILGNIASDGPDGLARLEYEDLYFIKLLRVSSRSELWLGEYFGEDVVVKKIKTGTVSRAVMRDFVEEVKLMAALSHPRIVDFRGALWDKHGAELCAVVEHMEQGALRSVTNSTTASSTLTVPKQYAIARQVAEALAYLHDQQIVHGRLNAFNILLDHEFSAKLSVFAVFHYVRLSPLDYECAVFVAPEVQRGQQPTEKADVYAFGVVLVELAAGESPETNRRRRLSLQDSSPEANSPLARRTGFTLGAQCSSMMKDLITACLERDPARRPSMAQIAMALQTGEVVV
jgi:serine/threonine protein kinase